MTNNKNNQSFIEAAIQNKAEEETKMMRDDDMFGIPRIIIVGCGGAGGNTITRLQKLGVKGAETIAINTDKQALDLVEADHKLLIGASLTRGLGAGGFPDVAERAARESVRDIEELLKGANLVFITAGMGGGTGTGSAPVVSEIAKKNGAIVTCMVSTPFNVERARLVKADEGLDKLRLKADSTVVLDNNRLLEFVPNLPINQAFSVMDQLIAETVKGISETICPSCSKKFNIHKNRSLKIKDKRFGMWFVDAMNQFENFSQVTCPFCSNDFKASEARLFGVFKSPYSIIGIAVVFIIILFALIFYLMP